MWWRQKSKTPNQTKILGYTLFNQFPILEYLCVSKSPRLNTMVRGTSWKLKPFPPFYSSPLFTCENWSPGRGCVLPKVTQELGPQTQFSAYNPVGFAHCSVLFLLLLRGHTHSCAPLPVGPIRSGETEFWTPKLSSLASLKDGVPLYMVAWMLACRSLFVPCVLFIAPVGFL